MSDTTKHDPKSIPMPGEGADIIGFYLSSDQDALDKFGDGGYRALAKLDDRNEDGHYLYIFEPEPVTVPDYLPVEGEVV